MLLFNRYEYNPQSDFIGKGGFSKVYKAFDKKFQRFVALKVYNSNELDERYSPMAEIQRVIDLDHPNICRYLDFEELQKEDWAGEVQKVQVGIMELLDGGNLFSYHRAQPDMAVFKKLLTDVLQGLAYLHNKGIIHRDIKPANILIKVADAGPVAKITDFGISKKSGSINSGTSSALIVSIPYMAPEQLNVQKYGIDDHVSFNIDFWSLGVTVYEVISGEPLFKNSPQDTSEQIMINILSAEIPPKVNDLPEPFRTFVSECLTKDAKQRVRDAASLLGILQGTGRPSDSAGVLRREGEIRKPEHAITAQSDAELSTDITQILPRRNGRVSFPETETAEEPPASNDDTAILPKRTAAMHDSDAFDDNGQTRVLPKGQGNNEGGRSAERNGSTSETDRLNYSMKLRNDQPSIVKQQNGKALLFARYEYAPEKDLIGKGGFSRVYRAFDRKLSRWVALKIYKVEDFVERYSPIAEIKRVITLDHPNICRYLDIEEIEQRNLFGEDETIQVCVMELLDGGNLMEYFNRTHDTAIFKKLLNEILNGLSYLHRNGIIHRDIKPANILIKETREGPVAKITDFGISKNSDSVNSESSSSLIVSIPYMAPEQLNLKKYGLNNRIQYNLDLWSLGVTIYEVLAGRLLFKNNDDESSEQIMANIMAPELPQKINDLPEPFRKVVFYCVVKNAKERAQTVEELLKLLNSDEEYPLSPVSLSAQAGNSDAQPGFKRPVAIVSRPQILENQRQSPETNTQKLSPQLSFSDEQNETSARAAFSRKSVTPVDYLKQQQIRRYTVLAIFIIVVVGGISVFLWNSRPKFITPDPSQVSHAPTPPETTVSDEDKNLVKRADPAGGDKATAVAVPVNANTTVDTPARKTNFVVHHAKPVEPQVVPRHSAASTPLPVAAKSSSTEMVLGVTSNRICKLEIRNVSKYWVISEPKLGVGEKLKVYLKPGLYALTATSLSSDSSKKTASIEVRPDDVGNNRPYKIEFNP